MRYLMKQKFFSLGGAFYIKNNLGQDVFSVEGAAFSFGHQLTFRDLSGNELAFIRQKLLSWDLLTRFLETVSFLPLSGKNCLLSSNMSLPLMFPVPMTLSPRVIYWVWSLLSVETEEMKLF